jgi:hypothetical protein
MNATWHAAHPMPSSPTEAERLAWHAEHSASCGCRPMPAKLQPLAAMRALLEGGDRRSLARSEQLHAMLRAHPERISALALLAEDPEYVVAMRAVDLLEKLALEKVEWVQPFKRVFIGPLADEGEWEVQLQIVRALPLFKWTAKEQRRVREILRRDVWHPQRFVAAWALDSLAKLADDPASHHELERGLKAFEHSGSKALLRRAKKIRQRLGASQARA